MGGERTLLIHCKYGGLTPERIKCPDPLLLTPNYFNKFNIWPDPREGGDGGELGEEKHGGPGVEAGEVGFVFIFFNGLSTLSFLTNFFQPGARNFCCVHSFK